MTAHPRPHPETGLPRPPPAPRWHAERTPSEREVTRWHVAHLPAEELPAGVRPPPPGRGRVLEVLHRTRSDALWIGLGVVVVGYFLGPVLQGWALLALTQWWFWMIVATVATGAYFASRGEYLAAGSDWYQHGKSWVDLYDLTEVKVTSGPGVNYLRLTDGSGRRAGDASVHALQENSALWDLVYNGVAHSVAVNDVTMNARAHNLLRL